MLNESAESLKYANGDITISIPKQKTLRAHILSILNRDLDHHQNLIT